MYYPTYTPIIPNTTCDLMNKQYPILSIYQPMNQNQPIINHQFNNQAQDIQKMR